MSIALVHSVDRPAVSRDFLVRQSILNALAENFPWGVRQYGPAEVLRRITTANYLICHIVFETCAEYRKLTGAYRETPSEEDDLELVGFSGANWP